MKGSYWFKAKSKKVLFEFSIRRNITVIKGDSATGKTTLLHILYEYLRIGRQSGYDVSTNASYYVYIRDEVGRDWKDALYPLKNTVIFIEENNEFVFTKEFASYVKESGNSNVTSSNGNGNLIKCVKELGLGDTLVIADGAAFGSLIETCINSFQIQTERRISLWLPESFEYLILKSGILKSEKLIQILDNIPEYVECEKYESWEKFFTEILITLTADGVEKYSKNILNSYYLQDWVVDKIKEQLPIEVIN